MGKPAARITDRHVCPFVTPAVVPIPHVGGPITGPGAPTVFIGGMPAAVMGDLCTCVGPPAPIILGSMGVLIGGKPAARMGDMTGHGGSIVAGCPTVMIGEMGAGAPSASVKMVAKQMLKMLKKIKADKSNKSQKAKDAINQTIALVEAAQNGTPFCEECAKSHT